MNECTKPKTKTSVRRQTAVSFGVLQTCIMELLALRWLVTIEDNCGQKKLETTEKGLLFLRKYSELQILSGLKTSNKLKAAVPVVKTTRVQYKRKPKL